MGKYGKSIEGVISIEEMGEHFESVLPIGTQIELTGLKDEAYNGKIGVVASALSNTGRLMIMLDSGKAINIRPINLGFGADTVELFQQSVAFEDPEGDFM